MRQLIGAAVVLAGGFLAGYFSAPSDDAVATPEPVVITAELNCQEDEVAVHTPYYTPRGQLRCIPIDNMIETYGWCR